MQMLENWKFIWFRLTFKFEADRRAIFEKIAPQVAYVLVLHAAEVATKPWHVRYFVNYILVLRSNPVDLRFWVKVWFLTVKLFIPSMKEKQIKFDYRVPPVTISQETDSNNTNADITSETSGAFSSNIYGIHMINPKPSRKIADGL